MIDAPSHPLSVAPQVQPWTAYWLRESWNDRDAVLAEATEVTDEGIAWFSRSRLRRREAKSAKWTKSCTSLVRRVFSLRLPLDGEFGPARRLTVPELLAPGSGRLLALMLAETLDELGFEQVALDMLGALRIFCRFLVDNYRVPGVFNLRLSYGELECPLRDGDVPSRRPVRVHLLPPLAAMPGIYDEAQRWAARRCTRAAWRTVAIFVFACVTGLRGEEIVQLLLQDQEVATSGAPRLLNGLIHLQGAKGGGPRSSEIEDEYGFDFINWWLGEGRLHFADPYDGAFFPSTQKNAWGERIRREALTERNSLLLAHLIERGFLDPQFTFHAARKLWARHLMLTHDNDVELLIRRAGWKHTSELSTYLAVHPAEIAADTLAFRRSLEVSR